MSWISVKDKMPDDYEWYLVTNHKYGRPFVVDHNPNAVKWTRLKHPWECDFVVTHWMEIPVIED